MTNKPRSRRRQSGDKQSKMVDAAINLAARQGWNSLSISRIAREAKIPFPEALVMFPTKRMILRSFQDRIDGAVAAETTHDPESQSPRDRLFDVLMRRLEILKPWKSGVTAIAHDILRDPTGCLCSALSLNRSMAKMIECAEISSGGLQGTIRVHGLTVIYLLVLRRWALDDSEDLSPTMAELDKRLKATESILTRICPGRTVKRQTKS